MNECMDYFPNHSILTITIFLFYMVFFASLLV